MNIETNLIVAYLVMHACPGNKAVSVITEHMFFAFCFILVGSVKVISCVFIIVSFPIQSTQQRPLTRIFFLIGPAT